MPFLNNYPIQSLGIENESYPKILREITDAPQTLYHKGNLMADEQCFAIVGTRRASDYGREIAFRFAFELARQGLTIVSGMARGIDTFSHKGALEASSRTIAVLGTGLDEKIIYPQENLKLAKKILEKNGCLLSEYPQDYPGSRFTFPQRNRIISGLSLGVLVVEAKIGSGALITAEWAKKQNRKVFAVPGSVHAKNSQGCHWLIKQGAILVDNPSDILHDLKIQELPRAQKQNWSIFSRSRGNAPNKNEELIIRILSSGNLHIDKIIEKTQLPAQTVSATLSIMEIDGKVKNLGGNVYALMR